MDDRPLDLPPAAPKQPEAAVVDELRAAAAAIDLAWASGRGPGGPAGDLGAQGAIDELTRARAQHFRKAAALCSMAARLIVDQASAGRLSPEEFQGSHESSSISQFLREHLAQLDQIESALRSFPPEAKTTVR